MSILILIFVLLAVFNLVWYYVVAPSLRLKLRYGLFRQRDAIRSMKIKMGEGLSQDVFLMMEQSVNAAIRLLPNIELSLVHSFERQVASDGDLRRRIEARRRLLDACQVSGVKHIIRNLNRIVQAALAINSAGWLPLLIPVAVALVCAEKISSAIDLLVAARPRELDRIGVPEAAPA